MNQDMQRIRYNNPHSRLRQLILAFFAPIYFHGKKLTFSTELLSNYAGTYLKRNIIAVPLTFAGGELLDLAGFSLLGTVMTGMFVMFTGLCSVYLAAMFEKNRDHH